MKFRILFKLLIAIILATPLGYPMTSENSYSQKKTSTRKRTNTGSAGTSKPKTSEEAKKRKEAAQKEIQLTEEQLHQNELEVKRGLDELGKLEGDIQQSQKTISGLSSRLSALTTEIKTLKDTIDQSEVDLQRMREEYLKAVKRMRVSRKNISPMAFIFSSGNFNQAVRRMRYLREFSSWRNEKSEAILAKVNELKVREQKLGQLQAEEKEALSKQKSTQDELKIQRDRQEVLVADLKKNGETLQIHLKRKQAEANELGDMISSLIAEEQRKQEEERQRAEAERKRQEEEQSRIEAEKARLEQERLLAEQKKAAEEAEDVKIAQTPSAKEKSKNTQVAQTVSASDSKSTKRERKKKDKKENEVSPIIANATTTTSPSPTQYADARKRAPRSAVQATNAAAAVATTTVKSDNFADMRGSLPNPATGSFKITSRFGRQSLPDLPDVVYDNPGIDAETPAGSSAIAVFKGKVSGVYMLPGYNTVVIVNHGGYYTVYGNIANPTVKVGDTVSTGQGLGSLALNEEDPTHSSIHFEVWKNRDKLNPQDWLR